MRQDKEMNLFLIEAEVSARELAQDDFFPKPMHRGGVSDIDRVQRRASAASEEGDKLTLGANNNGSRVPASAECCKMLVLAVGHDCGLDGIEGAGKAILARSGLKLTDTANHCARLVAVLDAKAHRNLVKVLGGRMMDLLGGENTLELEKVAIHRVVEVKLTNPSIHHASEFTQVDLCS